MARREELEMLGMNENNMLNVESEIGAAEQLDEAMFEELAPRGDFSKKALNNLVAAANRLLPLFEQSGDYPTFDADVDVLPCTIDSNTRLNDYATAKKMLRLSEENEVDMLNGYPLVTHGYRTTRNMITHFNKPVS